MNKLFDRWLPCVTLATWSGILLYFYFSGRVTALLAPAFRPYVVIAGIALGFMAAIFLLTPADTSCCAAAECGHSLSRWRWGKVLTFSVLLLPISVSAVVSPDSFGRAAIENRGIDTDGSTLTPRKMSATPPPEMPLPTNQPAAPTTAVAPPPGTLPANQTTPPAAANALASDYLQRTADGNIVAEVLDLLYAAQDPSLRQDFAGKKVELIGQLMPDKPIKTESSSPKRFKAVRMFMSCCAADARPVATLVEAETIPDLPEMTWIRVIGTSTFPIENGRPVAVLKAERVEKTNPPTETMLY